MQTMAFTFYAAQSNMNSRPDSPSNITDISSRNPV
jgi:hypothetical protein